MAQQGRRAAESEITYLSVGMWSSRSHNGLSLLILPGCFVFLADRTHSGGGSGGGAGPASGRCNRAAVLQQLGAKSPFNSSYYREAGCICAFEVPLDSVVGLDYFNPLLQPGRVVLEVHGVRKREFRTLESARAFYLSGTLRFEDGDVTPGATSPPQLHGASPAAEPAAAAAAVRAGASSGGIPTRPEAAAAAAVVAAPAVRRCQAPPPPAVPHEAAQRRTSLGARQGLLSRLDGCAQQPGAAGGSEERREASAGTSRCSSDGGLQFRPSLDEGREGRGGATQGNPWAPIDTWEEAASVAVASGGLAIPGARAERSAGRDKDAGPTLEQACSPAPPFHVGSAPALGAGLLPSCPASSPPSCPGVPGACSSCGRGAGGGAGAMRHARSMGDLLASSQPQMAQHDHQSHHHLHHHHQQQGQQEQWQEREQEQQQGLAPQPSWVSPWAFTAVSDVYEYRTIIFQFESPSLPLLLQPVIQSNERLLKMYESGLPTWAIFMPSYGFYYRPWLRTLTWLLYYAFSVFSLACGFYDLYKTLPGLQLLLQRVMSSLWLPPASILLWLDQHAQFRLSILLTYLFGKSEAFMQVMRWAGNVARGVRVALQPAADALGPPLAALGTAAGLLGRQAWEAVAGVWLVAGSLLYSLLEPFVQLALDLWGAVVGALAPLVLLLYSSVAGPLGWALALLRNLRAAGAMLSAGIWEAGAAVAAGATAVKGTVTAGKAVHRSAPNMASQLPWLYGIPSDVLELLHNSALKVMRAVQTVAKFLVQMMSNLHRHRQSLGLQLGRAWRRGHQRVAHWLALPGRVLMALAARFMRLVQMLLWLAVLDSDGVASQPHAAAAEAVHGVTCSECGICSNGRSSDPAVTMLATSAYAATAPAGLRHRHSQHVEAPVVAADASSNEADDWAAAPPMLGGHSKSE